MYEFVPRHTRRYQTLSTSGTPTLYHTNWQLKIFIWQLYFSSWSPKGNLMIFLISSPARSIPYQLKSGNTKSHYNNEKDKEGTQMFYFYVLVPPIVSILRIENRL